jgi:hypothetical protein
MTTEPKLLRATEQFRRFTHFPMRPLLPNRFRIGGSICGLVLAMAGRSSFDRAPIDPEFVAQIVAQIQISSPEGERGFS